MNVNRRAVLSWFGVWLLCGVVLTTGISGTTASPLGVACSPEQPVVPAGSQVVVRAWASAPEGASLRYFWTVEAGRVTAQAAEVLWDLTGVRQSLSSYGATVRVLGPDGVAVDCTLRVFVASPLYGTGGRDRSGRESGRMLLPENESEANGYGLYSYLLFGAMPEGEAHESYLQAIQAYLTLIPHLVALEKYFKPHELNVMYLPIQKLPPDTQTVTPEWVLSHYDYTRARYLMRALPGTHRGGPYLVSTLQPLGQTTVTPEQYLFQDLSTVPPQLASLWVREFLNQAAQQDFSQEGSTVMLVLRLRTTITRLGIALPEVEAALKRLGLPDLGTVVKTWITWRSSG